MRFLVSSVAAAMFATTASADLVYSSRLSYDHADLGVQQITADYAGANTDGEGINLRASADLDGLLIQGGLSETSTESSTADIDYQRGYVGAGRHWTLSQNYNQQTSIYALVGLETISIEEGPVSEDFTGLFTTLGLRTLLGAHFEARAEVRYHNLDGDGIDDRISGFGGLIEIMYRFTDHFGVGLAYDVTRLEGDNTGAEVDLEALVVFVRYYFN